MMDVPHRVTTFACLALLLTVAMATQSEEIKDNQISIRFDEVSLKQWNDDTNKPTDKFVMAVAASVTTYCSAEDCDLGTMVPFTDEDVVILDGYPSDENADVQIVFYVSIVTQDKPAEGNQYALEKSTLETILKTNKADIENATSYEVVFIGDERVGKPLDGTMNSIMIPLAIATLVVLILITFCLHFNEKRQEKKRGLVTSKRADIPSNDAHGEGIVLTSVNKNSGKEKKTGCREPRRKKKKLGSSKNGETPDETGSATTTQHIDVHPIPQANGTNSVHPTSDPKQGPTVNGSHASVNTNTNSNKDWDIRNAAPVKTKRGEKYRSRQIEPPPFNSDARHASQDGATEFLIDSDVASHSSNPGCIDNGTDEHHGDYQGSQARAADKEYLIQPQGRLPPLVRTSDSSSPAIEL
ncbi:uncharacterized protein LOC119724739 [Patiria miniata]|uniref:DUF8077 domain-containing protein n=1 Tax=Patiria miniata TaxID=46514 RepID=A0A913ZJ83_PATMI|nr:uncharacterized protein LOC119724739 [Patiria miniata]